MTEDIHSCSPSCDRPECVRAERDRLRNALRLAHEAFVAIERLATQSRLWGGMGWHYNPLRGETVSKIVGLARKAKEGLL